MTDKLRKFTAEILSMKRQLLILIAISLTNLASAQVIHPKQLDSLLGSMVKPNEPGFSFAIWQHDKLQYAGSYGLADLSAKRKNTPGTPFHIASMGKQFTAASIYLLEQQGKLSTADKLSKYFPDFPSYADSITLAQLIHHQSGIRDYSALMWLRNMDENGVYGDSMVYQVLSRQKALNFSPGTAWSYSNSGYFLLALIVKQVSGQDLITFANANIFRPLKMTHTQISRTHRIKNKANGYVFSNGSFKADNPLNSVIGQGNTYSIITDFRPWFREIEDNRVLGKAVWQKMLTPAEGTDYGGGLRITKYKNSKVISHGGDISGYHSGMYHFPESGLDIIVMSNNDGISGTTVFRAIYNHLYPQEKTAEAMADKPLIKIDTSRYTGIYAATADSMLNMELSIADNQIMLRQHWNNGEYPVVALNDSVFTIPDDPSIQFVFSQFTGAKAGEMTVLQDGQRIGFKRTAGLAVMDAKAAAVYAGTYYNPEIDARYKVSNEGSRLILTIGKEQYNMSRAGLKEGVFGLDNGLVLNFYKDSEGRVTGFGLVHVRVSDLQFVKEV